MTKEGSEQHYSTDCPIAPKKNGDNGVGAKAFGSIMVIVAVISGLWALMGPTNQRIDNIAKEVSSIKARLHEDEIYARAEKGVIAGVEEKLTAAEERFTSLETRVEHLEEWRIWWNRKILTKHAKNSEKLYRLETRAFGGSIPNKPTNSMPIRQLTTRKP